MNCTSTTRQAAAHHILLAAVGCFDDWKTGCCPVAAMLELVQAAVRVLLIAAAGVALALAGIVVSVLAYLRELYGYSERRKQGAMYARRVSTAPHHPRDRDGTSPSPVRKSRPRRNLSKPSLTPIPASPVASSSTPTSLATPPQSPGGESSRDRPQHTVSRKRSSPRKQIRRVGSPSSMGSSETAFESERTPRPAPLVSSRPLPPILLSSDSSPQASTDPSVASLSSGEHESPARGVLQRIKSQHSNMRDRCLIRAQSIPSPKPPRNPRRRTDPYQAPYHFPTPLSPDAGTYLQEVLSERHGRVPVNANVVEQVRFASLPSSPTRQTQDLPQPDTALSVPSPSQGEGEQKIKATRRHRWSWHMPHLPERTRSVDSARSTRDTPEKQHKDSFPIFKFGHNKRRSSGIEDVRT